MTGTLAHLVLAAVAFVGGHFLLAAPPLRTPLVARLGEGGFRAAYSALMIAALTWLGFAYGAAPFVELWGPLRGLRAVPEAAMLLAVPLLVCGVSQPNPTATGQAIDRAGADPAPGILKVTRHPVMWAFALWALAHIAPNGDLASLILFGSLAGLALVGTLRLDAKTRARDPEGFARLAAATSNLPFAALAQGRARLRFGEIGVARLAAAAAVYLALYFLHPWIAGVPVR